MPRRHWRSLCDGAGSYRADVSAHLPKNGAQVLFEAMGTTRTGSFHAAAGSHYFQAAALQDFVFLVVAGKPCEVSRWVLAT